MCSSRVMVVLLLYVTIGLRGVVSITEFNKRSTLLSCSCGKLQTELKWGLDQEIGHQLMNATQTGSRISLEDVIGDYPIYSLLKKHDCTNCSFLYQTINKIQTTEWNDTDTERNDILLLLQPLSKMSPYTKATEWNDPDPEKNDTPIFLPPLFEMGPYSKANEWNDTDTEKNDTLILLPPLSEMGPYSQESTTESEAPTLLAFYEAYLNLADTFRAFVLKNQKRRVRAIAGVTIPMPPTCRVPAGHYLKTASLKCKLRPSSVTCVQKCLWGYTLPSGIIQVFRCNHSEDKWVPHRFRECKPFVDCGASLIYPGTLKCTAITHKNGPTCKISCLPYEDIEEVHEDTYTCDINGKWDKKLPFCAGPGTGLNLVKVPKNTLHSDTEIEI